MVHFKSDSFRTPGDAPTRLDAALRAHFAGASWGAVRKLVSSGKVSVDGQRVTDPGANVQPGVEVQVRMAAPRRPPEFTNDPLIEFLDAHVVVVRKPVGISSQAHENEERSLEDVVRETLRRLGTRHAGRLRVVHRLDKVTSGLLVYARTDAAQQHLKDQFRVHSVGRRYLAVAHGDVRDQTIALRLVRDRGDGIRGTTLNPALGHHAVTHVKALERLRGCTLVECRLETGRTHQIRIHLAELNHPIVGDPLYTRGFRGHLIDCERTLLHAQTLAFDHPAQSRRLSFQQDPPREFEQFLSSRRSRG